MLPHSILLNNFLSLSQNNESKGCSCTIRGTGPLVPALARYSAFNPAPSPDLLDIMTEKPNNFLKNICIKKLGSGYFPGGPVVKTAFPLVGHRLESWWGINISHAHCRMQPKQSFFFVCF